MAETIQQHFQYEVGEQSRLIDQLQVASRKLNSLLSHLSGEGFDAFISAEADRHGLLWLAQGLAEEIEDVSTNLLVSKKE